MYQWIVSNPTLPYLSRNSSEEVWRTGTRWRQFLRATNHASYMSTFSKILCPLIKYKSVDPYSIKNGVHIRHYHAKNGKIQIKPSSKASQNKDKKCLLRCQHALSKRHIREMNHGYPRTNKKPTPLVQVNMAIRHRVKNVSLKDAVKKWSQKHADNKIRYHIPHESFTANDVVPTLSHNHTFVFTAYALNKNIQS